MNGQIDGDQIWKVEIPVTFLRREKIDVGVWARHSPKETTEGIQNQALTLDDNSS